MDDMFGRGQFIGFPIYIVYVPLIFCRIPKRDGEFFVFFIVEYMFAVVTFSRYYSISGFVAFFFTLCNDSRHHTFAGVYLTLHLW